LRPVRSELMGMSGVGRKWEVPVLLAYVGYRGKIGKLQRTAISG
jgi:hypothetical protein